MHAPILRVTLDLDDTETAGFNNQLETGRYRGFDDFLIFGCIFIMGSSQVINIIGTPELVNPRNTENLVIQTRNDPIRFFLTFNTAIDMPFRFGFLPRHY